MLQKQVASNFVSTRKSKPNTMETATETKTKWNLDPTHSEIGFKVKHMMITNVSGSFEKFDAKVETDDKDFATAKIEFTADINSITTANKDRDTHLKSPDFFDGVTYPQLKFVSKKLEKKDEKKVSSDKLYQELHLTKKGHPPQPLLRSQWK